MRFTDPRADVGGEHMWVKVMLVVGDEIIGYLDNIPAHVTNVKLHDEVRLKREDIEDIYPLDGPQKAS